MKNNTKQHFRPIALCNNAISQNKRSLNTKNIQAESNKRIILGFLQQLGVIPKAKPETKSNAIYFVDRFTMPKASFPEFFKRMEMNRSFIRNLEGFIRDEKMIKDEQNGNMTVMTVAVWENQKALDNAKRLVQEHYQKIGFNPKELYERLDIKMQREIFRNNFE